MRTNTNTSHSRIPTRTRTTNITGTNTITPGTARSHTRTSMSTRRWHTVIRTIRTFITGTGIDAAPLLRRIEQ